MDHYKQNIENVIMTKHNKVELPSNSSDCLTSDDDEDEILDWEEDCEKQQKDNNFIKKHQFTDQKYEEVESDSENDD